MKATNKILFTILLGISFAAQAQTTYDYKPFVKKVLQDIWVKGNLQDINKDYAANLVGHEAGTTWKRDQTAGYVKEMIAKYSDRALSINNIIQEGNLVSACLTYKAINSQTHKPVTSYGLVMYRIENHKIAEVWLGMEPALE